MIWLKTAGLSTIWKQSRSIKLNSAQCSSMQLNAAQFCSMQLNCTQCSSIKLKYVQLCSITLPVKMFGAGQNFDPSLPQFYLQLVFKAPLCITLRISDQKIVSGSLFKNHNFFPSIKIFSYSILSYATF